MQWIAQNRKAYHTYSVGESFEAGLVLTGTEVKSLRNGSANLQDGYGAVHEGEIFLHHVHIPPFAQGNRSNHEPLRTRKLLLKQQEIKKISGHVAQKGMSIIPLKLYFKNGLVKVEIALCKGKKKYDKREQISKESARREMKQARAKNRG